MPSGASVRAVDAQSSKEAVLINVCMPRIEEEFPGIVLELHKEDDDTSVKELCGDSEALRRLFKRLFSNQSDPLATPSRSRKSVQGSWVKPKPYDGGDRVPTRHVPRVEAG